MKPQKKTKTWTDVLKFSIFFASLILVLQVLLTIHFIKVYGVVLDPILNTAIMMSFKICVLILLMLSAIIGLASLPLNKE